MTKQKKTSVRGNASLLYSKLKQSVFQNHFLLSTTPIPKTLVGCVKSTYKKKNAMICNSYKPIFCSQLNIENISSVWTEKIYHLKEVVKNWVYYHFKEKIRSFWNWCQQHISSWERATKSWHSGTNKEGLEVHFATNWFNWQQVSNMVG